MSTAGTVTDTIVKITVHPPVAGGQHALTYFPRRRGDTTLYFTPQGEPRTPDLAREVKWEVDGLAPGQSLEISPKASSDGNGRIHHPIRIELPDTSKHSGEAANGPDPRPREDSWAYAIILKDSSGLELARIDPVIVIIDDP